MKKNILFIVLLSFISVVSFAQNDSTGVKVKDYPVNATFESGYLIDAQTVIVPEKKTLEMVIQHKFGTIDQGSTNLWGIYGSSNIRIGLNYVPVKNLEIGAGIIKRYMTTDLDAKWTVLKQTKKNSIPVSVALYGNVGIDGRASKDLADTVSVASPVGKVNSFGFSDRLSYFSQLIIARKFNPWLSLQAGVSFSHYNMVKYQAAGKPYDHDKVGVHFNGRVKVSPQGSIVFNYDAPLKIKGISEQNGWTSQYPASKPNLAFGYEVSTGSHAFQIYMASTTSLLPQENMMWNQNEMNTKGFAIGFTITRLWAF
ncbi:MAG TPA: hypothetical protein DCL77_00410 [Prolixibacteraceae bacterium]|jgi:hypothetical protein|nr:hypothetical protein [Prolixibacteraceae bacterium]